MMVRLSPQARRDLIQIASDIARQNPQAARRVIEAIKEQASALRTNPRRGPIIRQGPAVCRILAGKYLILYRVLAQSIDLLRVIHGARDLDAILRDEGET